MSPTLQRAAAGGTREVGAGALILALALLVAALFVAALILGRDILPLAAALGDLAADRPTAIAVILAEIRLPRAILGVLVGATLGLTGAALQGLLRNPLAEPGLLGISNAAGLGAAIVFYAGLGAVLPLAVPIGGMIGASVAVVALMALAGRDSSVLTLMLAGVAIASFASALTALVLNLAPNPFAALEIAFWMLGSLADRSLADVTLAAPVMLLGWVLLLGIGRALDALTLGEETARSLGVDVARLRLRVVIGAALAVGAAVAVSGGIAFVGLVVPHLLRPFVGHQPSRLLVASAFGGAALLLVADIAVRLLSPGPELKLGVLTALVGAPFFLYLIVSTRRAMR